MELKKQSPSLQHLLAENALEQLRHQTGQMRELGSENGVPKLDWVEGVARLLEHPTHLETVEAEARAIRQQGIQHILWAGMGGSVITVRVLVELGFGGGQDGQDIMLHPLDSTDPAALNAIVRVLARHKNLALSATLLDPPFLRTLLADVMMIGVSMGMTSEEPITHLEWFTALLEKAQLPLARHLLIMTLPASYLDAFARKYAVPTLPLQLDGGTGTGGRMSAPTTRVFLLPVALYLAGRFPQSSQLRHVLQQAWQLHHPALTYPTTSPFVQLAAALSDTSVMGACRLLLTLPREWQALFQWIEQLMEESLGKQGKGVIVFSQDTSDAALVANEQNVLRVQVQIHETEDAKPCVALVQPYLASQEHVARLVALTTSLLGWQLTMALYGYLQKITFAGQPAVENYKTRARALRSQEQPLRVLADWSAQTAERFLTLFAPTSPTLPLSTTPALFFADALQTAREQGIAYLDCTFNGLASPQLTTILDHHIHTLSDTLGGLPTKLRQAPAAYHSTEQSEMDGPPNLVSIRILSREHEKSIIGTYTDTFLQAQAVSTWQAMLEQGRRCYLLLLRGGTNEAGALLTTFFIEVERILESNERKSSI